MFPHVLVYSDCLFLRFIKKYTHTQVLDTRNEGYAFVARHKAGKNRELELMRIRADEKKKKSTM